VTSIVFEACWAVEGGRAGSTCESG